MAALVTEQLRVASGGFPVARVRTMEEIVVRSTSRESFNMLLLTISCSGAGAGSIGIYGLMAYSVPAANAGDGDRMALGRTARRFATWLCGTA